MLGLIIMSISLFLSYVWLYYGGFDYIGKWRGRAKEKQNRK